MYWQIHLTDLTDHNPTAMPIAKFYHEGIARLCLPYLAATYPNTFVLTLTEHKGPKFRTLYSSRREQHKPPSYIIVEPAMFPGTQYYCQLITAKGAKLRPVNKPCADPIYVPLSSLTVTTYYVAPGMDPSHIYGMLDDLEYPHPE